MRALELLNYLAALDDDGNLTQLGSMMSEFPLDPQVGYAWSRSYPRKFTLSIADVQDAYHQSRVQVQRGSSNYRCNALWYYLFSFSLSKWLSALIVPNIWLRPNNQRKEADLAKAALSVPDGDHLTLLNVYNEYKNST